MSARTPHPIPRPDQPTAPIRWGRVDRATDLLGIAGRALRGGGLIAAFLARGLRRKPDGDGLVGLVESLGPAAMKAGQIAATRRDLLPEDVCRALERLWSAQPAAPGELVDTRQIPPVGGEVVGDPQLLGSGTIGAVYAVDVADGSRRALKIRHPGITGQMYQDLHVLAFLARCAAPLPGLRRIPVVDMVTRICDSVWLQTDFAREAAALEQLADSLADLPGVVVPRPVRGSIRQDAYAMDFVEATGRDSADPEAAANAILDAVFTMLFVNGLVHVDLHPGNLWVDEERVVVLDGGFVVRIPLTLQYHLASFFFGLATGQGTRCAAAIRGAAEHVSTEHDTGGFDAAVAQLIGRWSGLSAREFQLAQFTKDLFLIQRRFGIYPDAGFIFPILSLLAVEGQVKALDPDSDFQGRAMPHVLRVLRTHAPAGLQ